MVQVFDLSEGISSRVSLRDGHRMPVLGLGVWRTPPGPGTVSAVASALEVGYRLIDTATLYRNEADVGRAVAKSGIPREELFITTKVWNDDHGTDRTRRAFETSLRLLELDYLDLYLIHWPVSGKRLETWATLRELFREGRTRSIGVSNFTVDHLTELLQATDVVPAVNQVEFHPFLFQSELLAYCRREGIQLEAYAPLSRGRRLDDPTVRAIAEEHGITGARVLLRWGLQHAVVVIPKSVQRERIEENARLFDFQLTSEEMERLDRLDEGFRNVTDPASFR